MSRFIEDYLVQGERFRGASPRAEALDQGFVTARQLACLVGRRRLLRVVPYEDTDRIELIHDRLVSVVCKARDERKEREQRAALEQKAGEAEARAREKEENNRRLIRSRKGLVGALAVCTVALALCVAVMLYAWHQQRRAMAYAAVGSSYQTLRSKPDFGILLALQAMSLGKAAAAEALPRAENVLRRALNQPIQFSLPHNEKVNAVAFSPDGRTLAAASGTDVQMWDPQTGHGWPYKPMRHPSDIRALAFSADGARLVSGDAEGNVKVWDTRTGEEN